MEQGRGEHRTEAWHLYCRTKRSSSLGAAGGASLGECRHPRPSGGRGGHAQGLVEAEVESGSGRKRVAGSYREFLGSRPAAAPAQRAAGGDG